MHLKTIVFITLVGLILPVSTYGQPIADYRFKVLTFQEGLSHPDVTDIAQDSLGYVWLGTNNGLNRYDGTEVVVFKHILDDTTSLPDNRIIKIFFDRQHRLWLITPSGVCRYRPASNDFRTYPLDTTAAHGRRLSFDITESTTGQILVLSHHNTVFAFSEEDECFRKSFSIDLEETARSLGVYRDRLLVGGRSLLTEVDPQNGKVINTYSLNEESSTSSSIAQLTVVGEQLWIAGPGIHLHTLNLKNRILKKVDTLPLATAFAPLSDRTLLVGSILGAFLYDMTSGQSWPVTSVDHPDFLKSVSCVFVDRDQNLWAAGIQKGVAHTVGRQVFHDARHLNESLIPYANEISAINVIGNQLWIGLNTGQVMTMNLLSHRLSAKMQAGDGTIFDLGEDRQGRVWAGSYRGGLTRYDPRSGSFIPYPAATDSLRIRGNDIRSIVTDRQDRLWLAVHGRGIDVYDPAQQRVVASHGLSVGDTDPFIGDWTYQTVVTPDGVVWIASVSGLQMIDGATKKYFQHRAGQAGSLSSDHVECLLLDRRGHLWVGTSEGLNVLNPQDSSFTKFTTQQGLNDNYISSLVEDAEGRLWVGTYDGLACLSYTADPRAARVQQVTLPPGQYSHQFVPRAGTIDSVGNLYFATTHGLLTFHPEDLPSPSEERGLQVLLNSLEVLSASSEVTEAVSSPVVGARRLDDQSSVQLEPEENSLAICFSAIDFVHSDPIQYYYQLKGHSRRWLSTTDRCVTYYDLPPGEYEFLVKATLAGAHGFSEVRRLPISIREPWYDTTGGRLAMLLLGLALVALGIYELLARTRLKNAAQLNEKKREVDQLKLKFFMNMSHELRTPLTLMLGPLEHLSHSLGDKRDQRYLNLLQRNTKRLAHLVNQMLDLRQLEQQHYQLRLSEGNLVSFTQDIYRSFWPWAEQRSIDYQFEDRSRPSANRWFDSDVVDKILYNLLSNAFKYTAERGSIYVTVSDHATYPGWLTIEVSDTGVGIASEQLDKIFDRFYRADTTQYQTGTGIGLSLCQELVRLHRGEISVSSTSGEGSTFTVAIPTQADQYPADLRVGSYDKKPTDSVRYKPLGRSPEEKNGKEAVGIGETHDRLLVLVVDDNPDLLSFIEESLATAFRVVTAPHGREAFRKAVDIVPDAIVSDVMMPVMDGLVLTEKLKEDQRTSHIPVILLTARADDHHQIEGLQLAADDYVTKPFSVTILTAKLQSLIANRARLRALFAKANPSEVQQRMSQSSEKAFLLKLTGIIEQHLDNVSFGTDDVCQAIGMSRSQLYRKLSAVTGKSVHEFIKLHRLAKAAQLLRSGNRGVADVARSTGFKHTTSLTRAFKEHYGCPPSQYAKQESIDNNTVPTS